MLEFLFHFFTFYLFRFIVPLVLTDVEQLRTTKLPLPSDAADGNDGDYAYVRLPISTSLFGPAE